MHYRGRPVGIVPQYLGRKPSRMVVNPRMAANRGHQSAPNPSAFRLAAMAASSFAASACCSLPRTK